MFWSESGAQCLTCCRVHVQDATEHSGESGAAGQLGTRPRATLKLWSENQRERSNLCVCSNIETSYSFQDCPWPSPCVTGVCVGAGLHYTVHRSHTIHPQYSYTAHTRPVSSEHGEGNWKLVNTLVLQLMQWSLVKLKTNMIGAFLAALFFLLHCNVTHTLECKWCKNISIPTCWHYQADSQKWFSLMK